MGQAQDKKNQESNCVYNSICCSIALISIMYMNMGIHSSLSLLKVAELNKLESADISQQPTATTSRCPLRN